VSPGFFDAAGAMVIAGRVFAEDDVAASIMPVVIDDVMAQRLFVTAPAIGQTFQVDLSGSGKMARMQVIGVVRHLRHRSVTDFGREQLFVSSRLWPRNPASYIVRTAGDPDRVIAGVRNAVRELDRTLPIYDIRQLEDYVDVARAPSRFTMVIALVFAGVAVVLAAVGVYGVVAYSVGRRAHEFGIRRVLGAKPGTILGLVLGDALRVGGAGLLLGGIAALALAHFLRSLLFGVAPTDPVAFAAAFGVLGLALLLASYLPARRAARMPPMDVLRSDV
jgi:ABC-type antimicrobial peptide transport system permease subunit